MSIQAIAFGEIFNELDRAGAIREPHTGVKT
jgi:hypothetical protein